MVPKIRVPNPTKPVTSPPAADPTPLREPSETWMRHSDVAPDQIANGASSPNGRESSPKTSAGVAERSLTLD